MLCHPKGSSPLVGEHNEYHVRLALDSTYSNVEGSNSMLLYFH